MQKPLLKEFVMFIVNADSVARMIKKGDIDFQKYLNVLRKSLEMLKKKNIIEVTSNPTMFIV